MATKAEKLKAARRYAEWYLGYPEWADEILAAYADPEAANAKIDKDQSKYNIS